MGFEEKLNEEAKKAANLHDEKIMRENLGKLMIDIEDIFRDMGDALDWFYSPCHAFSEKTPYQVCLAGEKDRIKRAIYHISSGMPC